MNIHSLAVFLLYPKKKEVLVQEAMLKAYIKANL